MDQRTKKCPMCAEETGISSVTCEYCGAQFEVTSSGYCQSCHEVREADAGGHCQTCGSEVLDWQVESRFVEEFIQEPIPASQPNAPLQKTGAGRKNWLYGILAGILVLAVIGTWLWFGRDRLPTAANLDTTLTATLTLTPETISTSAPTRTPSPTPTSTPTVTPTRTPRPTATATPLPSWVTDFGQPILDAIADRPPDYQDDFSHATTNWQLLAGEVEISNGALVFTTDQDRGFINIPVPGMGFYNFVLVVDIDISGLKGEDTAEILSSKYFLLEIKHDGRWFFSSWENNVRHNLGNGQQQIRDTEKVTIRLISTGTKYAIYIDDIPVLHGNYKAEKTGTRIGLRAWPGGTTTAIVKYDNINIWDLGNIPNLP